MSESIISFFFGLAMIVIIALVVDVVLGRYRR
jgi:hypothetical protein